MAISRILAATDFSMLAHGALHRAATGHCSRHRAARLARQFGADVLQIP